MGTPTEADEQMMWREFESARRLFDMDQGTDEPEDACIVLGDSDEAAGCSGPCDAQWAGRQDGATYVELPDGDYHVCFGIACKHAAVDASKSIWCGMTGLYVGFHAERDHDASWTGRSTSSANPDDLSGTPQGGWLKRRDMYQASVDAHRMAVKLTDEECVYVPKERDARPAGPVKRGALCVDETADQVAGPSAGASGSKRHRTSKRVDHAREANRKLHIEAMNILDKLVNAEHCHAAAPAATDDPARDGPLDPRLQNLEFVRNAALRKYSNDVRSGARPFDMSTLHDICIHANEFVRRQRSLQRERDARALAREHEDAAPAVTRRFDGQTQRCCADLVVNLWSAVCSTPYMREDRRGNDSFRPFAAGILYGLKRGTYLPDGTCIVPELPMISAQLPQLRSQQASTAAKQLQSSSHRGLCSLHRSIASLDRETDEERRGETQERFRVAAAVAAMLRALCTRTSR